MEDIKVTGKALDAITKMAEKSGRTPEEFLNRAVGTQRYIDEAVANGKDILVADKSGRVTKLTF